MAWSGLTTTDCNRLEKLQRRAARLIAGLYVRHQTPNDVLLARAGVSSLQQRRQGQQLLFASQCFNDRIPAHLKEGLPHWFASSKSARAQSLRNCASFRLPRAKKNYLKSSPFYLSFSAWNALPPSVLSVSFSQVRQYIKSEYS